jgi:HEAT repeat protein
LNDKKIFVRWRAVEALAIIAPKDPQVISVLKSSLHDKSALVATVALEALDRISEI